jgi:hypothetical protein
VHGGRLRDPSRPSVRQASLADLVNCEVLTM